MLVFDSDLAPVVGQQLTWRPGVPSAVENRLALLLNQSASSPAACDLIVRTTVGGQAQSGWREADGRWLMRSGARLDLSALKALATAAEPLTFTCLPPGQGKRVALNGGPTPAEAVIEYYHAGLDQYFITADRSDISLLDSTPAAGLSRTGEWFRAGGSTPVCRFYGSVSPGPNTHFYTVIASECDLLRQLAATTPATQPKLNFEKFDFHSTPPNADGSCPSGTVPVYRAYNEGHLRGRAIIA